MKTTKTLAKYESRKKLLIGAILALFFSLPNWTLAQADYCDFDEYMDMMMQNDPALNQIMIDNEAAMQSMMNAGAPQAIMTDSVYTIPVVFHVIHLGEPLGVGSNLSNGSFAAGAE